MGIGRGLSPRRGMWGRPEERGAGPAREAPAGGIRGPGGGGRGREGAGLARGGTRRGGGGGGCGAGGGVAGPGTPPPGPLAERLRLRQHWRQQRPESDWRGAPTTVDRDASPRGPSAARPAGAKRDPGAAGSAGGCGGGTMRRPWGALLLGALLCAHGKRRRRARADRPPGKVCPWVPPLQNSDPGSRTARAGPETPRPRSQQ